ncbi:MAG: ribose-5-phosphate isomerase [Actinomycetes bacterium]
MRVHIGCDHAAFELKSRLVRELSAVGYEMVDHGAIRLDPADDYPVYVLRTAVATAADLAAGVPCLGIVLGGSGNGEQMAANKVRGIRAALAWNEETARLAREHNNANVVSIGAREHDEDQAVALVALFLATEFSQGARHQRRLAMLDAFEASGALPPLPAPPAA